MIVPDVNLLLYAYREEAPFHDVAVSWWEGLVNGNERVGIPWLVSVGFVRLMTNRTVMEHPISWSDAVGCVSNWFEHPQITPINPGVDHLSHLRRNLDAAGVAGNLVPDAHLAALAMEYQAELHSNDLDFNRFPGLRWRNPLQRGA